MKRDTLLSIKLPTGDYAVREPGAFARPKAAFTRKALAAAHVVADPMSTRDPWLEPAIDWDATLAYRRHLWSWGFGVAEAMDTAQRGMGLDWETTRQLITRSIAEAKAVGGDIACGASTDQLPEGPTDLGRIVIAGSLRADGGHGSAWAGGAG